MNTNLRRVRRQTVAFVAVAAMMFALVPTAPASAGQYTIGISGTAHFSGGFLNCGPFPGRLNGQATGLHGTTPLVATTVTADFLYCHFGVGGTADGTITFSGGGAPTHTCNFTWTLTGFDAITTVTGCDTSGTAVLHFTLVTPSDVVVTGFGIF